MYIQHREGGNKLCTSYHLMLDEIFFAQFLQAALTIMLFPVYACLFKYFSEVT